MDWHKIIHSFSRLFPELFAFLLLKIIIPILAIDPGELYFFDDRFPNALRLLAFRGAESLFAPERPVFLRGLSAFFHVEFPTPRFDS